MFLVHFNQFLNILDLILNLSGSDNLFISQQFVNFSIGNIGLPFEFPFSLFDFIDILSTGVQLKNTFFGSFFRIYFEFLDPTLGCPDFVVYTVKLSDLKVLQFKYVQFVLEFVV